MRLGPPPRMTIFFLLVGRASFSTATPSPTCLLEAGLVGRVEVGRVGLELGGAGVDPLEDRADAVLEARLADLLLRRAGQLHQAPVGHAEPLAPQPAPAASSSIAAPLAAPSTRAASSSSTIWRRLRRNQGSILVSWNASASDEPGAQRLGELPEPIRARAHDAPLELLERRRLVEVEARSGRSPASGAPCRSSP